jgi:hypothetical protein
MKTQSIVQAVLAALGLGLVATAADAETITIEPDNYVGLIGDVAPGAKLRTFRSTVSGGVGGFVFHPVYSVEAGNWAPTGNRVFGKRPMSPGEPSYHWNDLQSAYLCESGGGSCFDNFYVFRVNFDVPTNRVTVQTILGDSMADGMELHAYNSSGTRIMRCRLEGWNDATYETGVVEPPRYIVPAPFVGTVCGRTVAVKNCENRGPGDCDYVVQLTVSRVAGDISYVQFGGGFATGTYALVDKLQYWIP